MPVLPGGLHVWPIGDVEVGDVAALVVVESSPLAPDKPGMLKGMQSEGRSLDQSKIGRDHFGLLLSSPRFASMEREREMSALLVSFTPVFDAPAVWLQRPFGSEVWISVIFVSGIVGSGLRCVMIGWKLVEASRFRVDVKEFENVHTVFCSEST